MRTILLASSGEFVTEGDLSFLSKPIAKMKMAYVITASKGVADFSYMERHKKRMKELGYDFEEIDIDGKNEKELRGVLANKDVIYVEGGNTFYLLKSVRESGFNEVIKDLIESGVVYIGSSAGAYIVCPTIEMATWKHQDKYDNYGVTDFTALNLVPFMITAHYSPENRGLLKEKVQISKYPVRVLTDEQAILIQDGKIKLIGGGEEVKL